MSDPDLREALRLLCTNRRAHAPALLVAVLDVDGELRAVDRGGIATKGQVERAEHWNSNGEVHCWRCRQNYRANPEKLRKLYEAVPAVNNRRGRAFDMSYWSGQ